MLTINLFDASLRCHEHRSAATPYDDPALVGEPGLNIIVSWCYGDDRNPVLTDGCYFCPACHQVMLKFSDYDLMWD